MDGGGGLQALRRLRVGRATRPALPAARIQGNALGMRGQHEPSPV